MFIIDEPGFTRRDYSETSSTVRWAAASVDDAPSSGGARLLAWKRLPAARPDGVIGIARLLLSGRRLDVIAKVTAAGRLRFQYLGNIDYSKYADSAEFMLAMIEAVDPASGFREMLANDLDDLDELLAAETGPAS